MIIHDFTKSNSILNKFIFELRHEKIQLDRLRFRRNIERCGEILGYELSKTLNYKNEKVKTSLGNSTINTLDDEIVICSILRAGLPLHQGLLNYFDDSENTFISAYRHHTSETEFEIKVEYLASPSLENKVLILADPILATGSSYVNVYESLKKMGTPKDIHLVSVIGAKAGLKFISENLPGNAHLWIATVDEKLNDKGYIVPGLGDAGDLAYGPKLQS